MKILFIGLGSIGQRHLTNAKKIFGKAEFFALRIKNKNFIIKNAKLVGMGILEDHYKIKVLKDYNAALKLKPNLTFICNPSSKHLEDAIKFAKIKSHLFIEKPLGRSEKLERRLIYQAKKNKLVTMVGYQSRYHPFIKKVKEIIKKKKFGKIVHANFNHLTFLPSHHKYEDYKKSYAAQKKLGGGVIDGLIHEIDLIAYFFGLPVKHTSIKENSRLIKMDCEDTFNSFMSFKKMNNTFSILLRLSYAAFKEERNFSILFEKALVKVCFIKNEMEIYFKRKKIIKKRFKSKFKKNQIFIEQLKDLKRCINKKRNSRTSIISNQLTQKLFLKLIK